MEIHISIPHLHFLLRISAMERTRFIEHRGTRILLQDFSGIRDPDEALKEIRHAISVVARQPPHSLRLLTIVREARYNAAVLQAMKEMAAHNAPYVKASAIVGMSGLHRVAYQTVLIFTRRKIPAFDSEAEALDWLAEQP
jgi:hypothetical protein